MDFAFSHPNGCPRVLEPLHARLGCFQQERPGLTQQPGKRGDGSSTRRGMMVSGCSNSSFATGVKKRQILVWCWGGEHEGVFGCDGGSCGWVGGGDGLMGSRNAARPIPSHGTVPQVLLTLGIPTLSCPSAHTGSVLLAFTPFNPCKFVASPLPAHTLPAALPLHQPKPEQHPLLLQGLQNNPPGVQRSAKKGSHPHLPL